MINALNWEWRLLMNMQNIDKGIYFLLDFQIQEKLLFTIILISWNTFWDSLEFIESYLLKIIQ